VTAGRNVHEFAELAEQYCALIGRHAQGSVDSWLHEVHVYLPLLYSRALALPDIDGGDEGEECLQEPDDDEDGSVWTAENSPDPDRMTGDQWQRLFDSLRHTIGSRDTYLSVFDAYGDPIEPVGVTSLADDLADIFRDLLHGLNKFRRGGVAQAAWEWRFSFTAHWAHHAASALKAIESLAAIHDLGFPLPTARQSL
jgi:hypothetical protein